MTQTPIQEQANWHPVLVQVWDEIIMQKAINLYYLKVCLLACLFVYIYLPNYLRDYYLQQISEIIPIPKALSLIDLSISSPTLTICQIQKHVINIGIIVASLN